MFFCDDCGVAVVELSAEVVGVLAGEALGVAPGVFLQSSLVDESGVGNSGTTSIYKKRV